jgi:hypothetical protein
MAGGHIAEQPPHKRNAFASLGQHGSHANEEYGLVYDTNGPSRARRASHMSREKPKGPVWRVLATN